MGLTKEQRARLAAAELKRRQQLERYRYYKIPRYFEEASKTDAHTVLLPCPNRVGKSTWCAFKAYYRAMGCDPFHQHTTPNVTWLLGPTLAHVKEVLVVEMRKWGLDRFWKTYSEKDGRIIWNTGSVTYVKSYDERKNIQGRSIDFVIIDEECSQDIFYELMMRTTAENPLHMIVAATPIDGEEWFADLCERAEKGEAGLYLAPEISIYDAHVKNGGHLTDDVIKRIEQMCVDDRERQVRLFGRRIRRAGQVIPLDAAVHKKSWAEIIQVAYKGSAENVDQTRLPRGWLRVVGLDPHPRKPTSAVWVAFNPANMDAYVYDHMRLEGTVKNQVNQLKERNKDQAIFAIYMDPAAKEAMKSNMIEVNWNYFDNFALLYPQVPVITSVKSREVVLDAVKYRAAFDANKQPKLYFLNTLDDLWRSIKSVRWKEYRNLSMRGANPKAEIGKDDDLMALGYALVMHPAYIEAPDPVEESAEGTLPAREEIVCAEMGY